jgi:hypothetical protein
MYEPIIMPPDSQPVAALRSVAQERLATDLTRVLRLWLQGVRPAYPRAMP